MSLHPNYASLVDGMISDEIIKFGGPFELKNGNQSSFYINMRDMISEPDMFHEATYALGDIAERGFFDEDTLASLQHDRFLMGIPEAASEYAGAVSYAFDLPLLKRRVKQKTYGEPHPVEGRFHEGDDVVLLDDVVSSEAKSKLDEVNYLAGLGLKTAGVVVLVDRQQGGRTALAERGIDFIPVLTIKGIAEYALKRGRISQTVHDNVIAELDPRETATS